VARQRRDAINAHGGSSDAERADKGDVRTLFGEKAVKNSPNLLILLVWPYKI
jgi:hypothetical protein